jgi:Hint module
MFTYSLFGIGSGLALIVLLGFGALYIFMSSDDIDTACFPASAHVVLSNGTSIQMRQLSVGHSVLVARRTKAQSDADTTSKVSFISRKQPAVLHSFIRIITAGGYEVTVTEGHYTYVNDVLTPAGEVRVGHALRTLRPGVSSFVVAVKTVRDFGLFTPHTVHGDIVVGGVVMSTRTDALHSKLNHALLLPIRALEHFGISDDPLGPNLWNGASGQ